MPFTNLSARLHSFKNTASSPLFSQIYPVSNTFRFEGLQVFDNQYYTPLISDTFPQASPAKLILIFPVFPDFSRSHFTPFHQFRLFKIRYIVAFDLFLHTLYNVMCQEDDNLNLILLFFSIHGKSISLIFIIYNHIISFFLFLQKTLYIKIHQGHYLHFPSSIHDEQHPSKHIISLMSLFICTDSLLSHAHIQIGCHILMENNTPRPS